MGKEKNKSLLDGHESQCDKRAKEIVCKENDSRYTACNKNKALVRKYQIDGDVLLLNDTPPRCDYMILNDDMKKVYLIELKGYTFYKRLVFSGKSATHGIMSSALLKWKKDGKKVDSVWCNVFNRSPMKEDI